MGLFLYLIFLVLLIVIIIFSSKKFSPIPYFPSQRIDIPLIIKSLKLKNNQTVFDLGAGDGIVIFQAAYDAYKKQLNTKFIAVEINPILILILHFKKLFHPNKKNIYIVMDDIFKMSYIQFINLNNKNKNTYTFYIYISPWFIEKTLLNIKKQIKLFNIVSYMYEIKSLNRKKQKEVKGKNSVFSYNLQNI